MVATAGLVFLPQLLQAAGILDEPGRRGAAGLRRRVRSWVCDRWEHLPLPTSDELGISYRVVTDPEVRKQLPEVAEALEVSPATVHRDLRMARAWLFKELSGDDGSE